MLLAIDIGNTTVSFGLLKGRRMIKQMDVTSTLSGAKLRQAVRQTLKIIKRKYFLKKVVICSVVPRVLSMVEGAVKRELNLIPIVTGRDVPVPLVNRYRNPKQVGQDRLVGAYAAVSLYGAPVIVVDLGTAITLDVVSAKKEYLGGIIVPGIQLSAETLFQRTALLPRVTINKPRALIGKDTEGSILSGVFYGYGEMISGLIRRIRSKTRGKPKVIVTGGYTDLMRHYIQDEIDGIDRGLVFKGLSLISEIA